MLVQRTPSPARKSLLGHVSQPADTRSGLTQRNCNQIDPSRRGPQSGGKPGNSGSFLLGKGILRVLYGPAGVDGLHLNDYPTTRVRDEEIEFAAPNPNIAINDGDTAALKKELSDLFTEAPHLPAAQI